MKRALLLLALSFATSFPILADEKAAPATAQQTAPKPAPRLDNNVELKADLPYADNANPRQALDLYLPKMRATEKPLPASGTTARACW